MFRLISGLILAFILLNVQTMALVNSSIICLDNATLSENISVYKDANLTNLTLQTLCPYGCDNLTKSCSPNPLNQNLLYLALFIGTILFMVVFYKVV